MNKKRGLRIVKKSVSPQPLSKTNVYLGHKLRDSHSIQGRYSHNRRKFSNGGCGCGSSNKPKQGQKQ